jgi:hypothetical protein
MQQYADRGGALSVRRQIIVMISGFCKFIDSQTVIENGECRIGSPLRLRALCLPDSQTHRQLPVERILLNPMEAPAGEQELCFIETVQLHSYGVTIDGAIQR